jgi:hypothetical protein
MRPAPVALATLFFFGCATVQVRGAAARPEPEVAVPVVALEPPLLDLWVEGTGSVSEPERERAVAEAEMALAAALEGRGFAAPEKADAVLTVRAQGLAQTEGRRSSRVAVMAGVFVLLAAVVVLAVASGKGGGGRGPAVGGVAKAAPVRGTVGGAGRVASAPPRTGAPFPGGATPAPPRDAVPAPRPARSGGGVSGGLQLDVQVHAPVEPVEPTFERRLPRRGFFDGDEIEVILELWDSRSGELLFSRAVYGEADPRNPREVRALVDRALAGQPWALPAARPEAGPP